MSAPLQGALSGPYTGIARKLHAEARVLDYLARLSTRGELAQQFGLSARRLNDAFAAEYGQSIFNFVTGHRLDEAHASLLAGHTPLKVLAARLGYSHVNHFIAAFKRRFGYPPGSLRRKGEWWPDAYPIPVVIRRYFSPLEYTKQTPKT